MLRTVQVEQSNINRADEEQRRKMDSILDVIVNPNDMLNKQLATYTTPSNLREIITMNVDRQKMHGKRLNLSKILGESIIYENGQAVQIKVCVINNEAAEKKMLLNHVNFPERYKKSLKKMEEDD